LTWGLSQVVTPDRTVVGENRVGFFTKADVEPGEELNFDYKYERYGQVR
jgi:SET domain-containing protein